MDNAVNMLILPAELLCAITSHLSNRDIKNVRLTNKRLRSSSILRFDRAFLSPSYKNIEVLRAIAAHPEFGNQVKELVYDDARFVKYTIWRDGEVLHELEDERRPMNEFLSKCEEILNQVGGDVAGLVRARTGADPKPDEVLMEFDDNVALYQQLYEEQQEIIGQGLDIIALMDALLAFPALKKVTLTSEAHQLGIHAPRYPTPLIRSFPPSFNYPAPWPWCGRFDDFNAISLKPWVEAKNCWRGFSLVLKELAHCERRIPAFTIDVNWNHTGIAHQFLVGRPPELVNLEKVCENLERLDLAINIGRNDTFNGFRHLASGPLRRALSKAIRLRRFSLHTSAHAREIKAFGDTMADDFVNSLRCIPLEIWPNLSHLTLSHFLILSENLLGFLCQLPPGITSLTFVDIKVLDLQWSEILEQFKTRLHYEGKKPHITIAQWQEAASRKVWMRSEVARFLDGGDNPFVISPSGNEIRRGFGTVRDDFDESFEEPWGLDKRMHM